MLLADHPQEVDHHSDVADVITDSPSPIAVRLTGLDGLRAIAVTAVLLFHADFYWARGGYLGVDLFFVISGFLITGLLASEIQTSKRLDLGQFYWRRAKRLLPAAWLMMAGVIAAAAWFATDALPHLRGDATASLVYLTNWELLRTHTSYFEATGRPPLLQHLWSLAIEEQFYIVWAPLVLLGLPRIGRRGLAVVAAILAIASAAWMAVLAMKMGYPDQGDPSRLYFGTDTHGFPLLLGAVLGLSWQPSRATRPLRPVTRGAGFLLGLAALAMMFALFACLGEETPSLYPWGFLLAAASSITLVATATHPGLSFGRWLDSGLLRWIGERSYGIYLWHWPVFMLTRPGIDVYALDANTILILRMALTVCIAALSYRYLEAPIRHGALERLWRQMTTRRSTWLRRTAVMLTVLMAFGAMGAVLLQAPTQAKPAQDVRDALGLDATASAMDAKDKASPAVAESTAETLQPVEAPAAPDQPDQPPVQTFTGQELTAVGDSVLLGSGRRLKATLRGADVHATMGWQAADVIKQLKALHNADQLRPVTLIHLGTNGYITEAQLRQILSMLADRERVILVNTHVPRRWMETNNALIERVAPDFPNVVSVRWNDVSEGQPDYFVSDGVHLTDIGQHAFIAAIMREGHLVPGTQNAPSPTAIDTSKDYTASAGDLSLTLVRASQSAPSDKYWQKMALCETDANWQNAGRHSGGLGISVADWTTWGGVEFAPTPAEATPAQQIEVANRMSTQGWTQADGTTVKPIGFTTWRCVAALGRPPTTSAYTYTPQSVIAQSFHLGERGEVVRDLQLILGASRDGIYTKALRKKHLAYLKHNDLPETLAGSEP
ncbi:acyltransferase family protein [Dyella subtropica]|uniref:acyltransferase family protein n=1 Tax=Dyella subtropica TaxID=2992127 RepID=UPI00224F9A3E|nr:acyltransferase family protein [Dyella subtropica]